MGSMCRETMTTGYEYNHRPLDQARQEIRLLCFEIESIPRQTLFQKPLKCTIKHVSTLLDRLPEYYAVSYTWADSKRCGSIIVDGKEVPIPLNAEVALRYLLAAKIDERNVAEQQVVLDSLILNESPSEEVFSDSTEWPRQEFRFWIDAMSINQHDLEEKSWQLLLISDVFSQAREVLIWLGEDADCIADAAVNSISRVVEWCKDETNDLDDFFDKVWALSPKELSPRSSAAPLPSSCDLAALGAFYSATWFQRLWVLQESVLANRSICYRGSRAVRFYDVALAARWIWYRTFGRITPGDNQYTNHTVGIQNAATMWDMMSSPFIIPRVLSNLLLLGMRFDTADPRDHVYAILGLLNDTDFASLKGDLLPDYAISLAEVYIRVTRAIIEETRSLFILQIGGTLIPTTEICEDALSIPTWVPKFDWVYDVNEGSPCAIRGTGKGTSPDIRTRIRILEGLPSILTVQGLHVDQIVHLCSPWDLTKNGVETLKVQIIDAWTMTKEHGCKDSETSLEIAFAATICAGRNKYLQDIMQDKHFHPNFAAFFRFCGEPCRSLSEYFSAFQNGDSTPCFNNQEILKAMTQNSRNLRFFVTSRGRLGLAPKTAQLQDSICMLPGCDVPVVLRKNGGFWRYVGNAYIDGLNASGEWFNKGTGIGRLESELQWFNIE